MYLHVEELSKCSGCGTNRKEWEDENGNLLRNHEQPYTPEAVTCGGCRAVESFQASIADAVQKTPQQYRGLKVRLKERETKTDHP